MSTLNLSAEELLTTTRAVRQRLDFDKPVSEALIRECVELALQAPTGGNTQGWQLLAVFDADKRHNKAVASSLGEHPFTSVDQKDCHIGGRCTRCHIARVLLVPWGIRCDKFAHIGLEVSVGNVDGNTLLAFRL